MNKGGLSQSIKYILYLICILGLTVFAIFSIISFFNQEKDEELFPRKKVEDRLNIILPEECKLVYKNQDNEGFGPGEHTYYYVFEFTEEPTEFFEEYNFKAERDEEFESQAIDTFKEAYQLYDWYVPVECYPCFTIGCRYFSNGWSFMVYNSYSKYLYIYIQGY